MDLARLLDSLCGVVTVLRSAAAALLRVRLRGRLQGGCAEDIPMHAWSAGSTRPFVCSCSGREPHQEPMTDLFFIAVVLASFAAFWGFMRLIGRL